MDDADFLCPISREVMCDPVVAADGHTYEREMITEWLKIRKTSPLTNQRISNTNLIPNITLKKVIDTASSQATPMGVPVGQPMTPRGESSPHLIDVEGDELEAVKQSVYSAYNSNDEVLLVRRVAKVSNSALAARFARCKQKVGGRMLRLFHGTLEQSACSIAGMGFKIPEQFQRADSLQETGQLTFGKAVYFSEHADLACDFGEATLVIADVALGREWPATQSLPHLDAEGMRQKGKDSVTFARTHEYACYDVGQAMPVYVVTYRLVSSATVTDTYDRATLEAAYERMSDAQSVDWELVQRHIGPEGRPRQRHMALRKMGDLCRDEQPAMCARLPDALLRELTTQCLTLEAAEADAPVTWLALRLCWNAAYRDQAMQQRLVRQVGARTLTALLEHWNNDVVDRACGVILNVAQMSSSAREAFWAAETPMALAKLVSKSARQLLGEGPSAGAGVGPVPHALGAIANLAFAEDTRERFISSTRLRNFLAFVAEPLMDSWASEVAEEATRLFSCLIAEGHAPEEWLEKGGAEVFQKSVSLDD